MRKYQIIILISFLLELGFLTFFRGIAGPYLSPILLLLFSLIIGIYPLYINNELYNLHKLIHKPIPLLIKAVIMIGLIISFTFLAVVMIDPMLKANPVDPQQSDIIPTIQIMVQRFMNFEYPYNTITNWGILIPSFMPLQWLPFITAELFKIDYRWIPFIIWMCGIIFYCLRLLKKNLNIISLILLTLLPFAVLFCFIYFTPDTITTNIELLSTGFYMLLALSLLSNSLFFRICGLVFTLLSRFANLLWIPLNIGITYFAEKRKRAVIIIISIIAAVLLFYIIPFLSQNILIFQQGQKYKTKAAIAEWKMNAPDKLQNKPSELFNGVGVSCFFYQFKSGDFSKKVKALQKLQIIISILSILILTVIYFVFYDTFDHKLFNLLSLKIHLVIFFNFIAVPHVHFFIVPVFISVIILSEILSLEKENS